jgi:hypothetical protein
VGFGPSAAALEMGVCAVVRVALQFLDVLPAVPFEDVELQQAAVQRQFPVHFEQPLRGQRRRLGSALGQCANEARLVVGLALLEQRLDLLIAAFHLPLHTRKEVRV